MRYERIDNSLFTSNRKNYIKKVDSGSASVFISNDELPTNADELLPFVQNTNLLYLTGIDQEDTFLILAPQFPDKKMREILFIKETSEEIAIWEGNKLTKEEASKISGVETVLWNDQFENILPLILAQTKDIYLEQAPVGTYEITIGDKDYTIDVQADNCDWSFTKKGWSSSCAQ